MSMATSIRMYIRRDQDRIDTPRTYIERGEREREREREIKEQSMRDKGDHSFHRFSMRLIKYISFTLPFSPIPTIFHRMDFFQNEGGGGVYKKRKHENNRLAFVHDRHDWGTTCWYARTVAGAIHSRA